MSKEQFPESFWFGVATADHQVEAYDPDFRDIRDEWELQHPNLTARGRATDFWHRYPEDIKLAQELGCKLFRFSIAWSRVEPRPGEYNEAAFEHYRQVLETIRAAGMEPLVTLHHFTWPIHVEERGGLLGPDFPAIFAQYATETAQRLGHLVRYWITFNEPSQLIYGYIKPWWEQDYFMPPGLPRGATTEEQLQAVGQLLPNLFKAHTAARKVIKTLNPEAQVGANPMLLGLPRWLQWLIDRTVMHFKRPEDFVEQGKRFTERSWVQQGEVDAAIATLTVTRDRNTQVAFSEVYYVAGQTLMVQANSPIQSAADLANQSVVVVSGTTAEQSIFELIPTARVLKVADEGLALKALDTSQAAAMLSDDTILLGLMQQYPGQYRLTGDKLTEEPYAVAIALGNRELRNVIDLAIQQFKASGAWAVSYAQHFPGQPIPEAPQLGRRSTLDEISGFQSTQALAPRNQAGGLPLAQPKSTLRRIQDRGYLKVAVKENVPGFSTRDSAGQYSGLEIDLARAIAQYIFNDPSKVQFKPTADRQRIPKLRSFAQRLDPIFRIFSLVSTALTSNWWHLGMAGKLPTFLCPTDCIGEQDFVGFDYYWGISNLRLNRIQQLLGAASGHFENAPVWSGVLYPMLKFHAQLFPDKEILIVENGCVDEADGIDRSTYLQKHLSEIQRAQHDRVKVKGYVCWCITSNREWGLAFSPSSDFGLYHIELDQDPGLQRQETKGAITYRTIIQQRTVSEPSTNP